VLINSSLSAPSNARTSDLGSAKSALRTSYAANGEVGELFGVRVVAMIGAVLRLEQQFNDTPAEMSPQAPVTQHGGGSAQSRSIRCTV